MRRFPSGTYGRQRLSFHPAPFRAPLRAFAALVFVWHGDEVLLCNIRDRGWCIPSGRVEPGEDSCHAVHREALEEAGALLERVQYLGCYHIVERNEVRWADVFTAELSELVEITKQEESAGRKLVRLEELPEIYHLWNPLTKRLFEYAQDVIRRGRPRAS